MASTSDITRTQILLGSTGRWSDSQVEDAIDAEGSVPAAAVLLLESAATAAAFDPDVTAGSQSVKQSHVAGALRKAAQAIRDDYGLAGGAGTVGVILPTTGRDVLGQDVIGRDRSTHACIGRGVIGYGDTCTCGDLIGACSCC